MNTPIRLAIVGATGVVGRTFINVLEERRVPIQELVLFASERSEGLSLSFQGQSIPVIPLSEASILSHPVDVALFSAGSDVSIKYAPIFARLKTVVIDNSAAWRMDPSVPLIVPEVNPEAIAHHSFIIANPNCSTIQAVVAIKPLHDAFTLQRMVIATYQAVSGAGSKGLIDLEEALPTGKTKKFPYQISGNVIPHIDVFLDNGNTKEEEKIILETRKIMGLPALRISSSAVRVPVKNGHSEVINLEFEKPFELAAVKTLLTQSPGIKVMDDPLKNLYPMPILADGKDDVFVGRIRRDSSVQNGLNLFVVADNIRKGAATNAIQILELLLR